MFTNFIHNRSAHRSGLVLLFTQIFFQVMLYAFYSTDLDAEPPPKVPFHENTAGHTYRIPAPISLDLVWCPPGEFTYGQDKKEFRNSPLGISKEKVRISSGFWIGQFEVSRHQWKSVMKSTPWEEDNFVTTEDYTLPATGINWKESVAYCIELTKICLQKGYIDKKQTFVLPTEQQWEYATRAGTTTDYGFGDSELVLGEYAWYAGNSKLFEGSPEIFGVGKKQPNHWNLYDTHGNVNEWCSSIFDNTDKAKRLDEFNAPMFRVIRGGSSSSDPDFCKSSFRYALMGTEKARHIGFRVVLINFN